MYVKMSLFWTPDVSFLVFKKYFKCISENVLLNILHNELMEAAKSSFFSGPATKTGPGGDSRTTKLDTYYWLKQTVPMATEVDGGGKKALVAGPLKK